MVCVSCFIKGLVPKGGKGSVAIGLKSPLRLGVLRFLLFISVDMLLLVCFVFSLFSEIFTVICFISWE